MIHIFSREIKEKGHYLTFDGLGLVLVHKRLHFTQLQLQKPGHRENWHLHAWAWLPSTGHSAPTPFPLELPEPRPSRGPLPEWLYRQRHLCLLPARREAIMAGLVEEQGPGRGSDQELWDETVGVGSEGGVGGLWRGRWALTGCPLASPSGSRGRSGPMTAWEEGRACELQSQAGNEDDPVTAIFAFLFPFRHMTHLLGLVPEILFHGVWRQLGQAELEVGPKILINIHTRAWGECQSWGPGFVLIHKEGGGSSRQCRQWAFSQHHGSFEHLQVGLLPTLAKVSHHQL